MIGARHVVVILSLIAPTGAAAVGAQQPGGESGRVVATITTLDGTINMPGVLVELRQSAQTVVLASTLTDATGMVTFPAVPPGRYVITATRAGFLPAESAVFEVRPNTAARVLVNIRLTFVMPVVDVPAKLLPSPTDSVQPVSMSDMLSGDVLDVAPLVGDDYQNLMRLLPGVVRGPDGRLRVKGGQPTQSALQVSSASLVDPSSGDFDLELPGQSIESVEVLSNPFAAEYGRFSSSVTRIQTRRGTNDWEVKTGNLVPRISLQGVRGFEPRFSIRGPLRENRVFVAEDLQFRYVATPVKSLPDEPETKLTSFDSFTRVDGVVSARHTMGGTLILFPRKIEGGSMNTFRPPEVTPDFNQSGSSLGFLDRLALAPDVVLETTLSGRWFEINVNTDGRTPMVYAPQTQSGSFFNDQERTVGSRQWVEALTISHRLGLGEHVLKAGTDLQRSGYNGFSESRPVEVRRLDGSLAERTVFGARTEQDVDGTEFAAFVQDRWRLGSRLTLELGFRVDRDSVAENFNYSPRAGATIALLPEGRAILRGGYGKFVQRTPLNVGAFPSFEPSIVSRFLPDGSPLGAAVSLHNVIDGDLLTPEAGVGNVEWDQRFGRRVLFKLAFLRRSGSHEYIVTPERSRGEMRLSSTGASAYRELEATTRYLGGERRDLTLSYVSARGTADLNNYDQFFGNFRNPIIRANENNLIPTDVRHRLLVRGTIGLPGRWDFAPVLELRSGFPWSAVDEFQDFVGPRNRAGRLPAVHTLDFSLARPWHFKKYRFRAGVKVFNVFGTSAERDVQNNITSPDYGTVYNPIERSIGVVFGSAK
jgi:TonB-dependent receptor-like protein/carboxypeptidase family protein